MSNNFDINVREIELKDIDLIADYWLESEPDFLINMGVDLNKLPTRSGLRKMLTEQVNTSITDKKSYALIWELDGKQIGHSNVNGIEYGKQATMHLHLWESKNRKKGIGTELVRKSLPFYFEQLNIERIICEPYALNPAPNKTLEKVGFEFIKKYKTIPGSLNFEQDVNHWELTKEKYEEITHYNNGYT
jgi:RimJ/RimL family protein N-acetyltransferase